MPALINVNLTVLATDVGMQRGARAFLRTIVRPTFFARVPHVASSVRGNQGVFVVCQTQHCGSLTTDPSSMACAKPLFLQVSAAYPFTTRWPLAPGSCLSLRCRRLLGRETFSLRWVSNRHVVRLKEPLSANCLALDLFAVALAIVQAVVRWL